MTLEDDARRIVAQLTLEEKVSLCSGEDQWTTQPIERVDVPGITVTDGPHGVRLQTGRDQVGLGQAAPATCFPTASALAATWNRDLVAEVGRAIALECQALQVGVLLGPGVNLKRSPLCGRNFEYLSEDPVLTGELATAFVSAVQAEGVGTSLKHLAGNLQEYRRMTIDVVSDERSLRELELAGFERVVRQARPWTVMGAYNRLNGTYACEHPWLLSDVLRGEWGFEGVVVTDWGATNDRVAGLAAGCDLEMPGTGGGSDASLVAAVEAGHLDVAALDAAAQRLVTLALRARDGARDDVEVDQAAHHALARRVAGEAVVLLRNEGDALPIDGRSRVALVGALAVEPRFQGTGSSRISPTRVDNLRDELTAALGMDRVTFARGYDDPSTVDTALQSSAVAAAKDADVAVVFVGLPDGWENEGDDREHLRLPPSHDALVAAVAAVHDRVVVVLANGAPVEMPWIHDVEAVVEGYLGGQAAGGALADVLTGAIDPSGRLGETFPRHLDDVAAMRHFPGGPSTVEHREGLYVGYRFHTSVGGDVLFPFGHGLSYTTVEHGEVSLDRDEVDLDSLRDGGEVTVALDVTNTGERPGKHVVQVYVRDLESACYRPDRELAAFDKVELEPGETRRVELPLSFRSLAYWHPDRADWVVEPGRFEVLVGASVEDLRGSATLTVAGDPFEARDEPAVYRRPTRYLDVDVPSFATLLGRPLPPNPGFGRPFTRNTPIGATASTPFGRVLVPLVERRIRAGFADDPANEPLVRSMVDMAPLRTLLMGGITEQQLDTIVDLVNGRWVSGGERVVRALRATMAKR